MPSSKVRYTSLHDDDDTTSPIAHTATTAAAVAAARSPQVSPLTRITYMLIGSLGTLLLVFGIVCIGYIQEVGLFPARLCKADSSQLALHPTNFTHTTESIYAVPLSDESDHAWRTLFPSRGGIFIGPDSPNAFTYSVFHQLHCLAALRQGYFGLRDNVTRENDPSEEHLAHCIDFLRQVVMCKADLTREWQGGDAYDVERRCVDWEEVLRGTEGWEVVG